MTSGMSPVFGLTYLAPKRGVWASFAGGYEGGVPLELPDLDPEELQALPGSKSGGGFDTGQVEPSVRIGSAGGVDVVRKEPFTVAAQIDVQNLADREFAFNRGNPFLARLRIPRLISGSLKLSFKK